MKTTRLRTAFSFLHIGIRIQLEVSENRLNRLHSSVNQELMTETLRGRLVKNGGTESLGFGPIALMADSPLLSPDRKVSDACLQTQFHFRTSCVLLWNGKLEIIRGRH